MALQKTFTLPSGYPADYIRFNRIEEWDRQRKVCTVRFDLWKDAAAAASPGVAPAIERAFRLRAVGADFDAWFGVSELSTELFIAQVYAAARVLPVDWWNDRAPLSDAVDV